MSSVEFRNLIGRVGRIQYALYGNVFFVCLPNGDVEPENFTDLLKKEAETQSLSIRLYLHDKSLLIVGPSSLIKSAYVGSRVLSTAVQSVLSYTFGLAQIFSTLIKVPKHNFTNKTPY